MAKVTADGRIQKLTNNFSQDAGCSLNEPVDAVTKRLFSNCYDTGRWEVSGAMVLTDAPSSTYSNGAGALEGVAMVEDLMEHIASVTGRDPMAVRLANMKADHPLRAMSDDFLKSIGKKNLDS